MDTSRPPARGDIRDYRAVVVYFHGGTRNEYLFHKDDIAQFVHAQVKLHHTPGVNPHNGVVTSKIWRITSAVLSLSGPYWWTTASLYADDNSGARYIEGDFKEEVVWEDPKYIEEQIRLERG